MKIFRSPRQVLKILLAAGLVAFLLQQVDWSDFATLLANINPLFLVGYGALQLLAILLSVKKWQVVAKERGISFPLPEGFQQYLLGTFINNFLPATVGGDVYRSHWLSRWSKVSFFKAFYTVFFERLQGVWLIGTLSLFTPLFYPELLENHFILGFWLATVIGFLLSVSFFILLHYKKIGRVVSFLPERLRNIALEAEKDFHEARWTAGLFETFLFLLAGPVFSNLVLFWCVGTFLPVGAFFFLSIMATILVSIPISFGNIGVKEGAYLLLFSVLGVTLEQIIVVSLLSRSMQLFISLGALPLYFAEKPKKE